MEPTSLDNFSFEIRPTGPESIIICLYGNLVIDTAQACIRDIRSEILKYSFKKAVIDISGVTQFDDYGALAISEIRNVTGLEEEVVQIDGIGPDHKKILDFTDFDGSTHATTAPAATPNLFIQAGEAVINAYNGITYFIAFVGSIALSILRVARRPGSLRYGDIVMHMKTTGVDALPVVGLISLMLGLIIAFISSMQLKVYGANIYVANLVAVAMVSELGPIMTGIVVAGRSGSAYAAEISTMKISEEIDALYVMGFDPNQFLVLPRLIAAVIVLPILAFFSNLFAIAGGAIIGVTMLDIALETYIDQTIGAIKLFELVWGLFKASIFAVLIATTGCLRGFQAKGGAASVGNAATSAVVTSIFLIIFFDSMFAIIRIYWN